MGFFLLQVDLGQKDRWGQTALDEAARLHRTTIVSLLRREEAERREQRDKLASHLATEQPTAPQSSGRSAKSSSAWEALRINRSRIVARMRKDEEDVNVNCSGVTITVTEASSKRAAATGLTMQSRLQRQAQPDTALAGRKTIN